MSAPISDPSEPGAPLAAALETLRADREHGASWLAREAARALAAVAGDATSKISALERARQLWRYALPLAHARPSMAAVANTVATIYDAGWQVTRGATERAAATQLAKARAAAERVIAEWEGAADAITQTARPLIVQPGQRGAGAILTHSRSGTVEQVLTTLAASDGAGRKIIVTTSQPGGEGFASARALAAAGWRVTLIADAAMGLAMSQAGCVVLGADSVRGDGSLVNKVGSYPIALAARAAHIPVYVLCESLKIAPANWPLTLEEMEPSELLPDPIAGVSARNIYFDVTPHRMITAIITERGLLGAREIRRLARAADRRLAHLASSPERVER